MLHWTITYSDGLHNYSILQLPLACTTAPAEQATLFHPSKRHHASLDVCGRWCRCCGCSARSASEFEDSRKLSKRYIGLQRTLQVGNNLCFGIMLTLTCCNTGPCLKAAVTSSIGTMPLIAGAFSGV